MVYLYPHRSYTLLKDTSKYALSAVMSQEHASIINGKTIKHKHPITYISRLFQGSQMNWATLTKEAYVTYMTVKCYLSI